MGAKGMTWLGTKSASGGRRRNSPASTRCVHIRRHGQVAHFDVVLRRWRARRVERPRRAGPYRDASCGGAFRQLQEVADDLTGVAFGAGWLGVQRGEASIPISMA